MKKSIAIFLTMLFCVLLVSCSSTESSAESGLTDQVTGATSSEISSLTEASSEDSEFQIDESQIENLGNPKQEMELTKDQLIGAVDRKLKEKKYSLLSDQMPDVTEYKSSEMGITNENNYELGDGILLNIYSDKENDKITRIQFFMSPAYTTKESLAYYACCADAVIHCLDEDNAAKIEKKLNLSNIETNQYNHVDTEDYSFFYSVTDGTNVLMINIQK